MSKKNKTLKRIKTPSRRKFIKAAAATGAVAAVAASSLAAPAVAAERIELAMVTTWPRDFPGLGTGAQRFAKRLTDMSDGRFQVSYFASGERVKAFDSFDEVASGNAQMYHAADYYWVGKDKTWGYFTSVPFGLTYTECNAWIRFGGGQELWDAKLGASPVTLPGGQIYENLVSGAIDATEWVGPWNDEIMKFHEAAKYYYYPGFHEPGSMLAAGCNKSWLTGLSKSDQLMIECAAAMENDVMMSEYNARNGAALDRLINDHGVKVMKFSDKIYDAFASGAEEVYEEVMASSDLAARTHKSMVQARKTVGGWLSLADAAYAVQRNRVLGV